jgi:ankyrin repeat protein
MGLSVFLGEESRMKNLEATQEEKLFDAIKHDDANAAKSIIEQGFPLNFVAHQNILLKTDDNRTTNRYVKITPLDFAVNRKSENCFKLLLDLGAEPHHAESEAPALHMAVFHDHAEWVELLVKAGADPDAKAKDGITPLMIAAMFVRSKSWEILRLIASFSEVDDGGRTVLFYACRNARPPYENNGLTIIEACLNQGNDPNVVDCNGLTALHVAAESGPWAVDMLLKAGADIAAVDKNGLSFLAHCARCSHGNSVELALISSPDLDFSDKAGWTALHHAALSDLTQPVAQLLAAGADPNKRDNKGRTALMHLVRQQGRFAQRYLDGAEKVRLFITARSDPSLRDIHGNNVWHHLTKPDGLAENDFNDFLEWSNLWDSWHPLGNFKDFFEGSYDEDDFGPKFVDIALLMAQAMLMNQDGAYGISEQNVKGNTPVMLLLGESFFWEETLPFLKLLLSRQPDLLRINIDGDNVLTILCEASWSASFPDELDRIVAAVDILCAKGADVNARNFSGETPLSLATKHRLPRVVQILRKYGAQTLVNINALVDRSPTVELPMPEDLIVEATSSLLEISDSDPEILKSTSDVSDEDIDIAFVDGEDPTARQLHEEAYKLYQDANTAYQANGGGAFRFIRLSSGRRSVQMQVNLYRAYIRHRECNGPAANAANRPGQSLHNFGMAIDIVRGNDEALLSNALSSNGWVAAVEDEGWHFEAQAAPSFSRILQHMQQVVAPLSQAIADAIVNEVLFRCYIERNKTAFRNLEQKFRQTAQELSRKQQALRRRRDALNREAIRLNREASSIAQEESAIRALRRQLNNMVYRGCPNHEPFDRCTHEVEKQRWLQEKENLRNEIQSREASLSARKLAWQNGKAAWGTEDRQLRTDESQFRADEASFRRLKRDYEKFRDKMVYWQRQLTKNESDVIRLTREIQTNVDGFILR